MAELPDLTKFIFKAVYDKDDIIFPSTIGNLISKFRHERYLLYSVSILSYANNKYEWVPFPLTYEIVNSSSSLNNLYFDLHGRRISILKKQYDLEILHASSKLELRAPTLDSLSKLIFYFYLTKPPAKLLLMSRTKNYIISEFNKLNNDKSLNTILIKILRFIKRIPSEDARFRARVSWNKSHCDLDKLIIAYDEYHEYHDHQIQYNMINPIIYTIHRSLIYLNINRNDREYHGSSVYRQLNGIVFENNYKFIKKQKMPLVEMNTYQMKCINKIEGLIVYTKDCLLRITNAKR